MEGDLKPSLNIAVVHVFYIMVKRRVNKTQCLHLLSFHLCVLDIIKLFNPNLLGAAPSKTVHGTPAPLSETGFNLAVTGHNTL